MYRICAKKERLVSDIKKYIKTKEFLETKSNKKEKKPIYATRKLSIGLVSCMLGLAIAAPVVRAEDKFEREVQTESELPKVDGKKETTSTEEITNNPQNGRIEDNPHTDLGNELGISPEVVSEHVMQAFVKNQQSILFHQELQQ